LQLDQPIKSLISQLQTNSTLTSTQADSLIRQMVQALQQACAQAPAPAAPVSELAAYPIETDGYAKAFCPLTETAEFLSAWQRYGVVVGKGILSPVECQNTLVRVDELLGQLQDGAVVDANGTSVLSRGFFEIYHDASLADIRQNLRLYLHHVLIWQQAELWCSFDRFGIKPPEGESAAGLSLHVDQNPLVHPGFKTTQGVLALADCPLERGTFLAVSGSRGLFNHYADMAKNNGEYVELDMARPIAAHLAAHAQPLPLRAGDLVTWDSRTTHGNTSNFSQQNRYVAYISAGPAQPFNQAAVAARAEAFKSGLGSNVREALMHASKKPRYTAPDVVKDLRKLEQLSQLGRYLYGQEHYPSVG
jgi:hypothetical protein